MTTLNVNQGERIAVELPGYVGRAGFVDRGEGLAELSFPGRGAQPAPGTVVEVAGRSWTVRSVGKSRFVPSMKVLALEEVADAE